MPSVTYNLIASSCPAPCGPGSVGLALTAESSDTGFFGAQPITTSATDFLADSNWNAKLIDLAAMGGARGYAVLDGLTFSVSSLTLTVAKGHAIIDALVELSADTTCTLASTGTNYIWLVRGTAGAQPTLQVESTTANVANACFLGSVPMSGGAASAFDYSCVFYWRGMMVRKSNDAYTPTDTPGVSWPFLHQSLYASYLWDGAQYIRLGQLDDQRARTSGKVESCRRIDPMTDSGALLSTGVLFMTAVSVDKTISVSHLIFMSGTTALSGTSHAWAAIYDSGLNLLSQSADNTSLAWSANSESSFTLGAAQTLTPGLYYFGLMIAATGMPSLKAMSLDPDIAALAPVLAGTSTGSLTATAPSTASALTPVTPNAKLPYCYAS